MAEIKINFKSKKAQKFFKELSDNVQDIKKKHKTFADTIAVFVYKDIMEHFKRQEGPEGPWKAWSPSYKKQMQAKGKGGNFILIDTGNLRNNFRAHNYRKAQGGLEWYNNAKTPDKEPYAAEHNYGLNNKPKRTFMWLSDKGLRNINKATGEFMLRGL